MEAYWERKSCEFELDQLVVPSNGSFYYRWQIEDFAGSGRRDEIAIDNVSIQLASTTETVPEPESLVWGIVLAGVLVGTSEPGRNRGNAMLSLIFSSHG